MTGILVLAIALFFIALLAALDLVLGVRGMTRLREAAPLVGETVPKVSVVVPACNEEEHIESAVLTLLRQQYDNLEIIVVNDRSSDATGSILERLQQEHSPALRVVHVIELPPGWMGKNHALKLGADHAAGEYLLFTDADVHLEKSTLARAMGHLRRENLDHLCLIFKNSSPGLLLNSLVLDAGMGLCQCFRPWRAKRPSPRCFMGVGGFNLCSRQAYSRSGGFEKIRMHPVDDIMLGKLIKRHGFRQECLLGQDLVQVPWYAGVGEMIDGLSKNALAVVNYRFLLVPPLLAALIFLNILPFWGMMLAAGTARLFFGLTVLTRLVVSYGGTRLLGISPWCAVGTLISPYIMLYLLLKATWRNARDGGIYWRGTYYRLKDLRKNERLLF